MVIANLTKQPALSPKNRAPKTSLAAQLIIQRIATGGVDYLKQNPIRIMTDSVKLAEEPEVMQSRYDEISALTDALCREKLNEEYAQVCREMTANLARKRPLPLTSGHAKSWA